VSVCLWSALSLSLSLSLSLLLLSVCGFGHLDLLFVFVVTCDYCCCCSLFCCFSQTTIEKVEKENLLGVLIQILLKIFFTSLFSIPTHHSFHKTIYYSLSSSSLTPPFFFLLGPLCFLQSTIHFHLHHHPPSPIPPFPYSCVFFSIAFLHPTLCWSSFGLCCCCLTSCYLPPIVLSQSL